MSRTTKRSTTIAMTSVALLLVISAIAYQFLQPEKFLQEQPLSTASTANRHSPSVSENANHLHSPAAQVLPYSSKVSSLPPSLHGSRLDYQLTTDSQGNLRISSDLRSVFDFFLSAIHEEALEVILQRIEEYLDYQLDEPALSQAKNLMADYISLKESLLVYEQEQSENLKATIADGSLRAQSLDLLEAQLDARDALRAEHLGPEVQDIFFESEQQYDRYTLARMRVLGNDQLSESVKAEQLARIDAQAPDELVASRRETQIIDELKRKETRLRESGAGHEAIQQLRTDMFGTEAAERFAALDQSRNQWQQRLDSYLSQRQHLLNNTGLTEEDRLREIERLRQSRFDSREQIRVKVYERRNDTQS